MDETSIYLKFFDCSTNLDGMFKSYETPAPIQEHNFRGNGIKIHTLFNFATCLLRCS